MRKRTIANLVDSFFWLLVAILPIVLYLITCFSYKLTNATDSVVAFLPFMKSLGLVDSGLIYKSLSDLFGTAGILPLFSAENNAILVFLSYFVSVEIVHLAVDFLLFIPRLGHKYMNTFTQNEV